MKHVLFVLSLLIFFTSFSQTYFAVQVIDSSHRNLPGVNIQSFPSRVITVTDPSGKAAVPITDSLVQVSALGFFTKTFSLTKGLERITLIPSENLLSEVVVSAPIVNRFRTLSAFDIAARNLDNSQQVLEFVPGLFIAQHAGGGKADQIFLRGFDIDHGTDVLLTADGLPVNMVSHAHGQGYADLHFVIPELIREVSFRKGMYDVKKGNFATAGHVDFVTHDRLPEEIVKLEAGMFGTFRTTVLANLFDKTSVKHPSTSYAGGEYLYSHGYFNRSQHLKRVNLFSKWTHNFSQLLLMRFSISAFNSKWDASGQIPERAVASGRLDRFGAIDTDEGGSTSRINVNTEFNYQLRPDLTLLSRIYYSKYSFGLFSNFTFFKDDSVNGDEIYQGERRDLYGYESTINRSFIKGNSVFQLLGGISLRADKTDNSELSRSVSRKIGSHKLLGDISETNHSVFSAFSIMGGRFEFDAGVRADFFSHRYNDHLSGTKLYRAEEILSPKANFAYKLSDKAKLYLSAGNGFHSNDTRVLITEIAMQSLPAAFSSDAGLIWKPERSFYLDISIWHLRLQQEFVYVGDEGIVEPGGRTIRSGIDFSMRHQLLTSLFARLNINYAHARSRDAPKGDDFLALVPSFTSTGAINWHGSKNTSLELNYRYMTDRPANSSNSIVAKGYLLFGLNAAYRSGRFTSAIAIQNLFDKEWNEAQFETESRLQDETEPVSEIHFTPGTPFSVRISIGYSLRNKKN